MKNDFCCVTLVERNDGDYIIGKDLTDGYNEPTFYTTKKRGLKKGWEGLEVAFTDRTTFNQAINILDNAGLSTHLYCAVD